MLSGYGIERIRSTGPARKGPAVLAVDVQLACTSFFDCSGSFRERAVSIGYFFGLFVVVSLISIRVGMSVMEYFGILDHPGGHKQHAISTPFVGGLGVFAALIGAIHFTHLYFPEKPLHSLSSLALGGLIIFAVGLADDIWRLGFRIRLAVQSVVAMIMVFLGGVELHTLGWLISDNDIVLGWAAIPFTVFATVGLINALNMIDGIDGISGALSFFILGFIALLAGRAGNELYLLLTIAVMGGVAGFLVFNLRYPSNRRARVFLGDNGSMLLGYIFAWLFIALSQGESKAMTPVTALWLFAVPLMDTVSVMLRRVGMRKSPFHADRNHLHHLFIRAGFRVSDTVWILSLIQIVLGTAGIAGLLLGVPEDRMFGLFLATFCVYFCLIAQPRRSVLGLRRLNLALGLPCVFARGIFIGYFEKSASREVLEMLKHELAELDDFRLSLHRINGKALGACNVYGVVEIECNDDEESTGKIRRLVARIKTRSAHLPGVRAHLLMQRSKDNDRRTGLADAIGDPDNRGLRAADRRETQCHPAMYSAIGHKGRTLRTIAPGAESIHSAF